MSLPERLTLIRHGESEANVAQSFVKRHREAELPEAFATRHDSFMRLSPLGREQAQATGLWLREEDDAYPADRAYVSPHVRTRETAYNLHLGARWLVDDRFRERDWGEVFSHEPMSRHDSQIKKLNEFYWKPPGGESLATGLRLRVESVLNTLYRRGHLRHVLAVTHGEFMRVFQLVAERLTPEDLMAMDSDPAYKVQNTMVIQYASRNPANPEEISNHFTWRRAICPWDRSLDWEGGAWVRVEPTRYSDEDLRSYVEGFPPLLEEPGE